MIARHPRPSGVRISKAVLGYDLVDNIEYGQNIHSIIIILTTLSI
jgi:hypothetical protein